MSSLLKSAVIVLAVSVVAFLWGNWYVGQHPLGGLSGIFGSADSTYSMAHSAQVLGVLGFLLGAVLLIAALVRGEPKQAREPTQISPPVPTTRVTQSAKAEPVQDGNELMGQFGITFDGARYSYGQYRYDRLEDAVSYAKKAKEASS